MALRVERLGAGAPKPASRNWLTVDGSRADYGELLSDAGERAPVASFSWCKLREPLPSQRTTDLELERTRGIRLFN